MDRSYRCSDGADTTATEMRSHVSHWRVVTTGQRFDSVQGDTTTNRRLGTSNCAAALQVKWSKVRRPTNTRDDRALSKSRAAAIPASLRDPTCQCRSSRARPRSEARTGLHHSFPPLPNRRIGDAYVGIASRLGALHHLEHAFLITDESDLKRPKRPKTPSRSPLASGRRQPAPSVGFRRLPRPGRSPGGPADEAQPRRHRREQ